MRIHKQSPGVGAAYLDLLLVLFGVLPPCYLFCGCERPSTAAQTPKAEPPIKVQTTNIFRGPITRFVTLPGEIKPYQQATLYAKVAGYLKTITVDKGDSVSEGKLLAEIEVPELIAEVAKNKAELELAATDFKRLNDSAAKAPDLVTGQSVDDARNRVGIAKATVERAETLLNYSKIIAPFGGIVTRRMVDPGAFIPAATSGSSAQSAAILTLSDFSRVRVQVAVPEAEAAYVKIGQPVKFSTESLPKRVFQGSVTRFSYDLDDATKTMLVEIEMPNANLELRPGMYATCGIGLQTKPETTLLPASCVLNERSGVSVFVLSDGKARKVKVQTGFTDGVNTEVTTGVEPAQEVIVIGKRTLTDGQLVEKEKPQ